MLFSEASSTVAGSNFFPATLGVNTSRREFKITRRLRWWICVLSILTDLWSLSSSNVGELSRSWSRVVNPHDTKNVPKALGNKTTWVIHLVRLYYLFPVNCILYIWPKVFIWKSCLTPNLWLIINKIGLQKLLCPEWPKKDETRIAILTPWHHLLTHGDTTMIKLLFCPKAPSSSQRTFFYIYTWYEK